MTWRCKCGYVWESAVVCPKCGDYCAIRQQMDDEYLRDARNSSDLRYRMFNLNRHATPQQHDAHVDAWFKCLMGGFFGVKL